MYQASHTTAQLKAMHSKGARYIVVAAHSIGQHTQGDLISWHKTHDAAQRAAKPQQYAKVVDIADAIQDAEFKGL